MIMFIMAYQQIPTCHIPTRWEFVMMIRGGNAKKQHSMYICLYLARDRVQSFKIIVWCPHQGDISTKIYTQMHKYKNTKRHKCTNTEIKNEQIQKYTNSQIHKCKNTKIHKRTNTKIHKHTNTKKQSYTTVDTRVLTPVYIFC